MVKIRDWGPLSKLKGFQSCLPLCNPVDYTAHGILQARILEWVAFPFSRGSSQPRDRTQVSCIAGRFFTSWATREARGSLRVYEKAKCSPKQWESTRKTLSHPMGPRDSAWLFSVATAAYLKGQAQRTKDRPERYDERTETDSPSLGETSLEQFWEWVAANSPQ